MGWPRRLGWGGDDRHPVTGDGVKGGERSKRGRKRFMASGAGVGYGSVRGGEKRLA